MIRPDATSRRNRRSRVARGAPWLAVLAAFASLSLLGLARPSPAGAMTWSVGSSPNVGTGDNELRGVSCATATTCVAVGFDTTAGVVRRALAEVWDGSAWTVSPALSRGSRDNELAGVSCPSLTRCIAVGSSDNGMALTTLVEAWNGTTWSIAASPNPGAMGNELAGASCPSPSRCFAVGYSADSAGHVRTLVESWNGSTWSVSSSPSPNSRAVLSAVSCADTTRCFAVGYSVNTSGGRETLVETWNGSTWSLSPSPNPGSNVTLTGVSCPAPTSCVAVGNTDSGAGLRRTVIESWNGAAWSVVPSPNGPAPRNYLRGVACWTVGKCLAVGWYDNGTVTRTLAATSTGTHWVLTPAPNPDSAADELLSTSCATDTGCAAAGRISNGPIERTFALTGTSAPDVTLPAISVSSPIDGGYYTVGQNAPAKYTCVDSGGSGVASCAGTVAVGGAISTSTPGQQSFSVTATDYAHNTATVNAGYTVVNPVTVSGTVPDGGGSITTDPGGGATALSPIATTLANADAGTLSIDQGAVTLTPPAGLDVLGVQITVAAPPAAADAPLQLTFDLDAALLPPGTTIDTLDLLKAGALVADCPGASTLPVGVADCVSSRGDAPAGGGDLRLTALSDAGGQWNVATGTPSLPRLAVSDRSIVEGNSGTTLAQIPVSLSQPSVLPVSVSYTTTGATAHAGSDFVTTSGLLTFAPGQTATVVPVPIIGDTTHEPSETFAVTLSSPSGATLGDPVGVVTIVDNDPTPPGAPTVAAVAFSTHAQLTWSAPSSNGSPITSYLVSVYRSGELQTSLSHSVTCTQPCSPATNWTVAGLFDGSQYTFAVAARNVRGSGPKGTTTVFVTDISNGGYLPGWPSAPVATAGPGRVTVTWVAPLAGTATITSYSITPYKNGVEQAPIMVKATPTRFVLTSAAAGASYTFTIAAASFVGSSSTSARSNAARPT